MIEADSLFTMGTSVNDAEQEVGDLKYVIGKPYKFRYEGKERMLVDFWVTLFMDNSFQVTKYLIIFKIYPYHKSSVNESLVENFQKRFIKSSLSVFYAQKKIAKLLLILTCFELVQH